MAKVWQNLGAMSLRIFLTGRLEVEIDGEPLAPRLFPGRQGRRAFAYLAFERGRPLPRDELAEAVWADALPPAWDIALSSLVSKLRRLLAGNGTIATDFGCYELRLPVDAWVDVEAAAQEIDAAEGALRAGATRAAWGPANVAVVIARRPVLPGEEGAWVERQRVRLHAILVRALDCLSEICLTTGETPLAVQIAAEVVALEPFRETGYQRLMSAHAALGNRAEALRVYTRCRQVLVEEVGSDPSPATAALYLELLSAG